MELASIVIKTRVAGEAMTVREALLECVEQQVSALPYVDAGSRVTGRISVDGIFRFAGLPGDMIKSAHLLGDAIHHLNLSSEDVHNLLMQPLVALVEEPLPALSPGSPLVKALVMMERFSTDCLFLMEGGRYEGTLTHFNIARLMLEQ